MERNNYSHILSIDVDSRADGHTIDGIAVEEGEKVNNLYRLRCRGSIQARVRLTIVLRSRQARLQQHRPGSESDGSPEAPA